MEHVTVADTHTSPEDLRRLTDEQAALGRVATLVANGVTPTDLFSAVAHEVAGVLGLPAVTIDRYEAGGSTVVASLNDPGFPVGSYWPFDGPSIGATVFETGRPARVDDYSDLASSSATAIRRSAITSAVGVPIVVDGSVWGVICVAPKRREPVPADTESRLAAFTELVATAIVRTAARDAMRRLGDEQAALRRVATLVAKSVTTTELATAVAEEIGRLLEVPGVCVDRYEPDGTSTVLASWGTTPFVAGSRWPPDPETIAGMIFATGRPARVDDYTSLSGAIAEAMRPYPTGCTLGVPILVDDRVWGSISIGGTRYELFPEGTESRLGKFTELVATAIIDRQAREDLQRLGVQQAALRRVATLVAEGTTAAELFAAVAQEVAHVFRVEGVALDRYEPDGSTTVVGSCGDSGYSVGTNWPADPGTLARTIRETGRPARVDDYSDVAGAIGDTMRKWPGVSAAGVPIVVDGEIWGLLCVGTGHNPQRLPADFESRLSDFTELVATAVSNASKRAELLASRARVVAAGDEARRKIERDLHDGTQQRLIALGLGLLSVRATIPTERADLQTDLDRVRRGIESVLEDIRELSRGLHPPELSRRGLAPALRALARRAPLEVDLHVDVAERPPESVEIGVYQVVAEALANTAKHAGTSEVAVRVWARERTVHATIRDDGVGGAEPHSGLVALIDRVEALGGRLALESPPGRGTTVSIELPA